MEYPKMKVGPLGILRVVSNKEEEIRHDKFTIISILILGVSMLLATVGGLLLLGKLYIRLVMSGLGAS